MKVEQSSGASLSVLCLLSGRSRQAYYKQHLHQEQQPLKEELVVQQVMQLRTLQPRMGGRKLFFLTAGYMKAHGLVMGREAFFGMLDRHDLLVQRKRGKPRTTESGHRMKKYPDLRKDMVPTGPGQLWVSDITCIPLAAKDAFLSLVTDAYSRKIVGFHLSRSLAAEGTVQALRMAIGGRRELSGLIHHSDRGSQYCCAQYISELKGCGIGISMTQSGDPRDNAIAERVNGILKMELLQPLLPDLESATAAVTEAINIYNYLRPHSSISMMTPALVHGREMKVKRCWKNYYSKQRESIPAEGVINKKEEVFKKKKSSKKRKTC